MPQEVRFITFKAQPSAIRHAVFDNKEHLVVPLIALVEGVLQASNTPNPELALASEFGAIPASWDGRPVTLGHPKKDGKFVSANSPDVLENVKVGMLFNTHLDGDKLKTEAWLDMQKMPFDERARLTSGKEIEVSTGFFAEVEPKQGEFKGKVFMGIQRDIKPDHLAILAEGDIGACSFADGCGAPRLNKDDDNDAESNLPEGVRLSKNGGGGCSNGGQCSCGGQPQANSLSTARHTKGEKNSMNDDAPNTKVNAFQKALTALKSAFETFTSVTQEEPMDKEALVAGIVDADGSKYSQEDKERLLGLPEDILMDLSRFFTKHGSDEDEVKKKKIAAKAAEAAEAKANEVAEAKAAEEAKAKANGENGDDNGDNDGAPMSVDQYIESQLKDAPQEVRDMINAGVDKIREEKAFRIKGLQETKRCAFSDEELEAMDTQALENLVKLANVPDYSGAGGPHAHIQEDENAAPEPLLVFEKTA